MGRKRAINIRNYAARVSNEAPAKCRQISNIPYSQRLQQSSTICSRRKLTHSYSNTAAFPYYERAGGLMYPPLQLFLMPLVNTYDLGNSGSILPSQLSHMPHIRSAVEQPARTVNQLGPYTFQIMPDSVQPTTNNTCRTQPSLALQRPAPGYWARLPSPTPVVASLARGHEPKPVYRIGTLDEPTRTELMDGAMVSDGLIDLYLKLIVKRAEQTCRKQKLCVYPSYTLIFDIDYSLSVMNNISSNPEVFDMLLFPMVLGVIDETDELRQKEKQYRERNEKDDYRDGKETYENVKAVYKKQGYGEHWALAAFKKATKSIHYYDSLWRVTTQKREIEINTKLSWIQYYINEHMQFVPRIRKEQRGVPQQSNDTDCGIFVCKYAECLAFGMDMDFSQNEMTAIRQEMANELAAAAAQ
ncbi:uncharacterized protein LOC111265595 [Varroa jacobsoni]|uniref:uncharacterized protein LOC111265595 n=1 Tax=Varroa jacobsoni TaxID=62625 RepID=UPI000BF7F5E9|nr:uncharacterized protein LOC111265595 [Varroa jacobsoni]